MSGTQHSNYASDHTGRSERSFLAAAHNTTNSAEARLHSAQEYAKLHEERTGEKIDAKAVVAEGDAKHGKAAPAYAHDTRTHH